MKLTQGERLILIHQLEIRRSLEALNAEDHDEAITVLRRGYESHYEQVLGPLAEFPAAESAFVLDVLAMYRALEAYKARRPEDESTWDHRHGHFQGFDANKEPGHFHFARYLLKTRREFPEQRRYERPTCGFNSRKPVVAAYAAMLAVWRALPARHELERDDVVAVLRAADRVHRCAALGGMLTLVAPEKTVG